MPKGTPPATTGHYNSMKIGAPRVGPLVNESHNGLELEGPASIGASIDNSSAEIEVGGCLLVCLSIGVGLK